MNFKQKLVYMLIGCLFTLAGCGVGTNSAPGIGHSQFSSKPVPVVETVDPVQVTPHELIEEALGKQAETVDPVQVTPHELIEEALGKQAETVDPVQVMPLGVVDVIVPNLSVNQIYEKSIHSVVWILTFTDGQDGLEIKGEASGVLFDKELKLIVTNAHVTSGRETILVFFPVRDMNGEFIEEREFYINNGSVLRRMGYAVMGRVVAEDFKTDLAIVELEGLPETALEIDHYLETLSFFNVSAHHNMDENARVHVLGNPGDLKLWRWTGGFFQGIKKEGAKEVLSINADTYQGNSGGPVLNERGMLIGIVSRSNLRTNTLAIPIKYLNDLLETFGTKQIFSIQNDTFFTIHYEIKWTESHPWKATAVKPGEAMNHWYTESSIEIPEGYPKIRFDYIANDRRHTYRRYKLETYQRRAGADWKPSREQDAREYHFEYDSSKRELDLRDSENK